MPVITSQQADRAVAIDCYLIQLSPVELLHYLALYTAPDAKLIDTTKLDTLIIGKVAAKLLKLNYLYNGNLTPESDIRATAYVDSLNL